MNEIIKQRLYDQAKRIKDDDIRKFTTTALDNAPKAFWIIPASSSGKYHPPEDQGEGGLVRHLIKSGEISLELAKFYNLSEKDTDIVFAASIIHDIQKNGIPWTEHTDYTHGLIAYNWLEQFSLKQPEKDEIRNCIRYHMAQWVQPAEEVKRAMTPTTNEHVVQLSDYFSSRKCASFLPGIELTEDLIRNYGV